MTHSEKVGLIVCLIVVCLLVGGQGVYDFYKSRQRKIESAIISLEIIEQNRADSIAYKNRLEEKLLKKEKKDSLKRVAGKKKKSKEKVDKKKKSYRDFSKEPID